MKHSKYFYFVLVSIVVISWGSTYPVVRFLTQDGVSPYLISAMRVFTTFLFAVLLLCFCRQKPNFRLYKKNFWPFFLMGLTGACGFFLLMNIGVQFTQAGKSSLIVGSNPILIVIFSSVLLGEPFGWRKKLGVVLAFSGIILAVAGGGIFAESGFTVHAADFILFAAAICWASYSLLSRHYGHRMPYFQGLFWIFASAMVMILPLFLYYLPEIFSLTAVQWFWLLFLGLWPGGMCFLLWNIGLNVLGASVCGMFNSFMPVSSIMISAIWLGEAMTWLQLCGVVLVIIGIWQGIGKSALPINYETGRSLEAMHENKTVDF